jgi:NitT/TauT family transport system ATP-binding protein
MINSDLGRSTRTASADSATSRQKQPLAHRDAKSSDGAAIQPKIRVSGVTCTFGAGQGEVRALGPLDLSIGKGEFICVVGPSGCGKSTLLRLVGGLRPPTDGRIEVDLDGTSLAPMATVFQDFGIFPWKTVIGNVAFGLRAAGVAKREAQERAQVWLKRLGLGSFADAYPGALSGGMRQRVAIARALAVEPEVILMDEPFAALDAQLREILQEELLRICEEEQRTVIFITHSLEEALVLGDRVLVMSARPGTIIAETVVPFGRPRSTAVRESTEFQSLRLELWEHLRRQVDLQMEAG